MFGHTCDNHQKRIDHTGAQSGYLPLATQQILEGQEEEIRFGKSDGSQKVKISKQNIPGPGETGQGVRHEPGHGRIPHERI